MSVEFSVSVRVLLLFQLSSTLRFHAVSPFLLFPSPFTRAIPTASLSSFLVSVPVVLTKTNSVDDSLICYISSQSVYFLLIGFIWMRGTEA